MIQLRFKSGFFNLRSNSLPITIIEEMVCHQWQTVFPSGSSSRPREIAGQCCSVLSALTRPYSYLHSFTISSRPLVSSSSAFWICPARWLDSPHSRIDGWLGWSLLARGLPKPAVSSPSHQLMANIWAKPYAVSQAQLDLQTFPVHQGEGGA